MKINHLISDVIKLSSATFLIIFSSIVSSCKSVESDEILGEHRRRNPTALGDDLKLNSFT